ncbi:MAG: hypothetical protein DHS20C21_21720 [Gemmatimonadota bacterium]|nr:MAG: hypothetical protein DHS20C21_21720 [Gemmatimonadota bacterium]
MKPIVKIKIQENLEDMQMRLKTVALVGVACFVAALFAPAADAEQLVPGSVLVWPYVDTDATVISITNSYLVNWDDENNPQGGMLVGGYEECAGGPPIKAAGQTDVHFMFFFQDENDRCFETNWDVKLSAQDHASFLVADEIGQNTTGWLVAFAAEPDEQDAGGNPVPWSFDFLMGQAWNVETGDDYQWSYNAYAFLSANHADVPADPCDRDTYSADPYLDFDGNEYERWGDKLLLPRFFEQGATKDSKLVLISPLSTFHDFPTDEHWGRYKVTFGTLFWNNDENGNGFPFSRTTNFECQFEGTLSDVSLQFEDLGGTDINNDDIEEQQTGWGIFDGFNLVDNTGAQITNDPPLLGVFIQYNTADQNNQGSAAANFFTRGFNDTPAQITYRQPNP